MSESKADNLTPGPGAPSKPSPQADAPSRVVIWAWPKTIVFWPTCLCALLFGVLMLYGDTDRPLRKIVQATEEYVERVETVEEGDSETKKRTVAVAAKEDAPSDPEALRDKIQEIGAIAINALDLRGESLGKWLGLVFLCVFAFNMVAFSFDVEVKGMAIAVLALALVVLGSLFLSTRLDLRGVTGRFIGGMSPIASASFYLAFGGVLLFVLFVAMVTTYLHRVDVTHNEVRVRTGLMGAERRISTTHLTFTKKVTDLMEHWILFFGMFSKRLGCGRLVFNHPQLESPIVLDNVIGAEKKAELLGKVLGVMAVKGGK